MEKQTIAAIGGMAPHLETLEARRHRQSPMALSSRAGRNAGSGKTLDKWLNMCLALAMLVALAIWARTMIEMAEEVIGLMNVR